MMTIPKPRSAEAAGVRRRLRSPGFPSRSTGRSAARASASSAGV